MSQNVQMFVINSSSDVHISCISVSNLTEIFYNFILCHLESFLDISSTFALFHQFECVYLSYLLLKCSLHDRYYQLHHFTDVLPISFSRSSPSSFRRLWSIHSFCWALSYRLFNLWLAFLSLVIILCCFDFIAHWSIICLVCVLLRCF